MRAPATTISASKFRSNLYRLLDFIFKSGKPIEIERKGQIFKIVPVGKSSKLTNLTPQNSMVGDPDDFIHMDWSNLVSKDVP